MIFFSTILFVFSAGVVKLISQHDSIEQLERTELNLKKEVSLLNSKLQSAENENKRLLSATNKNTQFHGIPLLQQQPEKQLVQKATQAEKIVTTELPGLKNHESLDESLVRLSANGNLSTRELKNKLDEEFSNTKNDLELAEANQAVVQKIFSSSPDLSGIALTNTECKSNQCRISVAITDISASNQLMQNLSKVINSADSRFNTAAILNSPDIVNNKITLYVMGIKNIN
jgi:predicted ribosome quality control (RQC) complex YloA/Tae2 family protein